MDNNISEIVSASLDVASNSVMFEFKTPLSAGIRCVFAVNCPLFNKLFRIPWFSYFMHDYRVVLDFSMPSFIDRFLLHLFFVLLISNSRMLAISSSPSPSPRYTIATSRLKGNFLYTVC